MKMIKSVREQWVKDAYRTNPLSLVPGGVTVTVVYSTGCSYNYDKVKNSVKYISAISRRNKLIVDVYVRGIHVWNRNKGWDKKYYNN